MPDGIRLVRMKDKEYHETKRKRTESKIFLLSSVIIAYQSFQLGRTLRIQPVNDLHWQDEDDYNREAFSPDNLNLFLRFLGDIDEKLCQKTLNMSPGMARIRHLVEYMVLLAIFSILTRIILMKA